MAHTRLSRHGCRVTSILPSVPQNLQGIANPNGTVTLTWEAPDDEYVTGYLIRRGRNLAERNYNEWSPDTRRKHRKHR